MNCRILPGFALLALLAVPALGQSPPPISGPALAAPFEKEVFTDPKDPKCTISLTSPTECEYGTPSGPLTGTYLRTRDTLDLTVTANGKPVVLHYSIATMLRGDNFIDRREYVSAKLLSALNVMGGDKAMENIMLQKAHTIDLCLFAYRNDHADTYPTGASSTEVFQKLIDGGYVTDPAIFCVPMPGKTPATSKTLKPENVCWDVTVAATANSADDLPLVFLTGYKISYAAGATAKPLANPVSVGAPFVVGYKKMLVQALHVGNDALVANVVSEGFTDPKANDYHQLTPDGQLTP